jgi:hypothetical protein
VTNKDFCKRLKRQKTAILFRIWNLEGEGGGISKRFDSEEQFRREALRNV